MPKLQSGWKFKPVWVGFAQAGRSEAGLEELVADRLGKLRGIGPGLAEGQKGLADGRRDFVPERRGQAALYGEEFRPIGIVQLG